MPVSKAESHHSLRIRVEERRINGEPTAVLLLSYDNPSFPASHSTQTWIKGLPWWIESEFTFDNRSNRFVRYKLISVNGKPVEFKIEP